MRKKLEYGPDLQIVPVSDTPFDILKRKETGRVPVCIPPVVDILADIEGGNEEDEEDSIWN